VIVWLASYPRSGNTLVRTVLHQTLGVSTYSDEIDPQVRREVSLDDDVERQFGHVDLPAPWEGFYREATAAPERFFVKTHRLPRDEQPAIYVVRDGRPVLASYLRFHRRFLGANARSLLDLVVGDDFYGGWSDHYRGWKARAGRTLFVRFEELVEPPAALLQELARFCGAAQPPAAWSNPFMRMHERNPGFFAAGKTRWEGDPEWTDFIDALFFRLHGDLMEELAYVPRGAAREAGARLGANEDALAQRLAAAVREKRQLEQVCHERLAVIEGLRQACDERLALIERMSVR
jgi:hypothetical protein